MSHIDFKKGPCRRVKYEGQWRCYKQRRKNASLVFHLYNLRKKVCATLRAARDGLAVFKSPSAADKEKKQYLKSREERHLFMPPE